MNDAFDAAIEHNVNVMMTAYNSTSPRHTIVQRWADVNTSAWEQICKARSEDHECRAAFAYQASKGMRYAMAAMLWGPRQRRGL